MSAFYDRMVATTLRMIKQYGMPVTLRRLSVGANYNPADSSATPTGSDGAYEETRYLLKLDQPGSQIAQRFGINRMKETLIERNEKWAYMEASGPAPQLQDKILMDGMEYSVLDAQACGPGGTNMFYLLVLRA